MDKLKRFLKRILSPYFKEILKSIIARLLIRKRKEYLKRFLNFPSYIKKKENIELIIFLVLDCLRKDHLSVYGYERNTTRFLKKMGKDGAVFTNAISASNWTYPSVISILSGLYPHNHGGFLKEKEKYFAHKMFPMKPHKATISLQDVLMFSGFDTISFTSLDAARISVEGTFNHHRSIRKDADILVQVLIRAIKRGKKKKFLYVHFRDLHQPIKPPVRYRNRFEEIKNLPGIEDWGNYLNIESNSKDFLEFKENKIKLYDSTLYFLDLNIERLFRFLEREGRLENTFIVVTADHGEEFWEHVDMEKKYFYDPRRHYGCGHGHNVFQEIISVPLMLFGGDIKKGVYNNRVSLVDIFPTLLNALGIPLLGEVDGKNLFAENRNRLILNEMSAYGYEKKAVFYKQYKMLCSPFDDIEWVFNLAEDPCERHPLTDLQSADIEKMRNYLYAIEEKGSGETISIDEETKRQLSQLGYV